MTHSNYDVPDDSDGFTPPRALKEWEIDEVAQDRLYPYKIKAGKAPAKKNTHRDLPKKKLESLDRTANKRNTINPEI